MADAGTTAVHVLIEGRVQGVGYRAWVHREATALGLAGWVRNRSDGSVEAVFSGDRERVRTMAEACRKGPRLAVVRSLHLAEHPPIDGGFSIWPTD